MSLFRTCQLTLFNLVLLGISACPQVETQPNLNLTEYQRATWYIQEQQVNGYQPLTSLYCVAATYNQSGQEHVPLFRGEVISVYNYCNRGQVNGPSPSNRTHLCARVANATCKSRLLVAPCPLPNLLGGSYWVLRAGPHSYNYRWAIVIGGPPRVQYPDGCTTPEEGVNGAGLWLFHRQPVAPKKDVREMRSYLASQGIAVSRLQPVVQQGCHYTGAYLKL